MAKNKLKIKKESMPVEPVEDRSMFNCPSCGGDGLVKEKVCMDCEGSGKFMAKSSFPEGTKIVTTEGSFVVKNRAMVKLEA